MADEKHSKTIIGVAKNKLVTTFQMDENGNYVSEGGQYEKSEHVHVKVKYEDEVRMGLAFGIRTNEFGEEEGFSVPPFFYDAKIVKSQPKIDAMMKVQIEKIKSEKGGQWEDGKRVEKNHKDAKLYSEDSVLRMKSVGTVKANLLSKFGIKKVKDFLKFTRPRRVNRINYLKMQQGLEEEEIDKEKITSCPYKNCKFQGTWNEVEKHKLNCEQMPLVMKVKSDNGEEREHKISANLLQNLIDQAKNCLPGKYESHYIDHRKGNSSLTLMTLLLLTTITT